MVILHSYIQYFVYNKDVQKCIVIFHRIMKGWQPKLLQMAVVSLFCIHTVYSYEYLYFTK